MSTECTDEDWERSEEALKRLQIEPQLAEQALFFSNSENAAAEDGPEGPINPALIDALQNPRERMNVLKYEDRILRFVKSSDSFLDVPPISNSYQRLLIYRVAERFALEHNPSEISNDAGDRGIIFFKTQRTTVPSILLINYKGEEIKMESSISAAPIPSKGPKIMQRRPNSSSSNQKSNTSNEKNQVSAEEKEKAYAAARARIFGEESPSDSPAPTPSPTTTSAKATGALRAQAPSFTGRSPVGQQQLSKQKQPPSPEAESEEDPTTRNSPATAAGNQKKKVVNVGAWKEKKVVLRDKQADKYDPDFARIPSGQNAPSPLGCPPYHQAPALITPQFAPSIPQVYPSNVVMHQPPSAIAPTLSSSQMGLPMHWNPSVSMGNMNSPAHWDRHQPPLPQHLQQQQQGGGFSPYDYQHHGHGHGGYPPQHYPPGPLPQQGIPVAPGLPDHLTRAPPSNQQQPPQSSYNKDFPPLA